jgi:hypothetical protein
MSDMTGKRNLGVSGSYSLPFWKSGSAVPVSEVIITARLNEFMFCNFFWIILG